MKKGNKTKFKSAEATEMLEVSENFENDTVKSEEEVSTEALQTDETEETPENGAASDEKKQLPPNVEKIKGGQWLPYVITCAVLAVITVLVGWARGGFDNPSIKSLLGDWCDAFFVPGILCVCFGLLVLGSNGGAFDMLAYGVRRLFGLFRKDPIDRKYATFYEYQKSRKEKRRSFWYLIIVGGAYTVVAVVLFALYYTM